MNSDQIAKKKRVNDSLSFYLKRSAIVTTFWYAVSRKHYIRLTIKIHP